MSDFVNTVDVIGDEALTNSIIDRTIAEFLDDSVRFIGMSAFAYCTKLSNLVLLNCSSIGNHAFMSCGVEMVSIPKCSNFGQGAFGYCVSLKSVHAPNLKTFTQDGFQCCSGLVSVYLPSVYAIPINAFARCKNLVDVSLPALMSIGGGAFASCTSLPSVYFPICSSIGSSTFSDCTNLSIVNVPSCSYIGTSAFFKCVSLTSVYLGASVVCKLANSNAFTSTPIASGTGYVYVPASLVDSYKVDSVWSFFANQIVAMEE